MRKVQRTAWGGESTAGGATGGPDVEATISAAAATVSDCEFGGCRDALASFAIAGFVPAGGRFDIWQQEPSPDGTSEICKSECWRARIIGHSSPPQRSATAAFGLQFANANSGAANSTKASITAASLTNRFTSPLLLYACGFTRCCDFRHIRLGLDVTLSQTFSSPLARQFKISQSGWPIGRTRRKTAAPTGCRPYCALSASGVE